MKKEMLNDRDYCDLQTINDLEYLGMNVYTKFKGVYVLKSVLLYDAQKWLREEKKLHIEVSYQPATWTCKIYNLKTYEYIKGYTFFVSYEEALLEGIKEAIKLLKEKK